MAVITEEIDDSSYIRQLTKYSDNQILITTQSPTEAITGFVDADIVFGANSTYNPESVSSSAAAAMDSMSKTTFDNIGSNKRTNSVKLSRQSWQTSSFNSLTFDLFIISINDSSINPLHEGIKIYDYLLPRQDGDYYGGTMIVPNGYIVNPLGTQENAIDVTIGSWFQSIGNCFLMQAGTMEVSKQKMTDGVTPLYVKINVTLQPSRDFFAEEVKSWFKGPGV